jgi:hypothetical protein
MSETFEYGGYPFTPHRQFTNGEGNRHQEAPRRNHALPDKGSR